MTQVYHTPGVPSTLPTVVASSATPVLAGPTLIQGTTTQAFSTETVNVWPEVLTERGVVVSPYSSSTPIVLPTQVGLFPQWP
jgi:hypothetical protein